MWNNGHYEPMQRVVDLMTTTRSKKLHKVHMPQVHHAGLARAPPSSSKNVQASASSATPTVPTLLPHLEPPVLKLTRETVLADKARASAHTEASKAVAAEELAERNRASKAYRVLAKAQRIAEAEADRAEAVALLEKMREARRPPPPSCHLFATRDVPLPAIPTSDFFVIKEESVKESVKPPTQKPAPSAAADDQAHSKKARAAPITPTDPPSTTSAPSIPVVATESIEEAIAVEWRSTTTPPVEALQLVPKVPYPENYNTEKSEDIGLQVYLQRLHLGGALRFILGEFQRIIFEQCVTF